MGYRKLVGSAVCALGTALAVSGLSAGAQAMPPLWAPWAFGAGAGLFVFGVLLLVLWHDKPPLVLPPGKNNVG